jgi:hypothetical protein
MRAAATLLTTLAMSLAAIGLAVGGFLYNQEREGATGTAL